MKTFLKKLLKEATTSLNPNSSIITANADRNSLTDELHLLLSERNGFYAFERALHFFPSTSDQMEMGMNEWNAPSLWRSEYGEMAKDCLFFAEDVFGIQFCIKNNQIYLFNPETGSLEHMASSLEEWAQRILQDCDFMTGQSLAHQWQKKHGLLPANKRLLPKIPFVCGGAFELDNVYLSCAVKGMRFRASIANQIKDLPDGAQITIQLTP